MGLFKKRAGEREEIDRLRHEIALMSERLEAAEHLGLDLDAQFVEFVERLEEEPDEIEVIAPEPPEVTMADLDIVRARLQRLADHVEAGGDAGVQTRSLADRLDELSQRLDDVARDQLGTVTDDEPPIDLRARLAEIDHRLDVLAARTTDADAGRSDDVVDPSTFASLEERVRALGERFDLRTPPPPPPPSAGDDPGSAPLELTEIRTRLNSLVNRVEEVDARITSISLELANQITELGNDLDRREPGTSGAGADAGDRAAIAATVEQMRTAQERLANEQARYQIAFQQELAALADRLRRP